MVGSSFAMLLLRHIEALGAMSTHYFVFATVYLGESPPLIPCSTAAVLNGLNVVGQAAMGYIETFATVQGLDLVIAAGIARESKLLVGRAVAGELNDICTVFVAALEHVEAFFALYWAHFVHTITERIRRISTIWPFPVVNNVESVAGAKQIP